MLIIRALAGSDARLENLSDSDDTKILQDALASETREWDAGHAGTTMRFLTAFAATRDGETILTGSRRMKQRPIGPLAEALKALGAGIHYLEKEGYPPVKISRGSLRGGEIRVEAGISSQFISALMMIGPLLPGGLRLTLTGEIVSGSYIGMTLALMNLCGVRAEFSGQDIRIPEGVYSVPDLVVESDWSAASYWFQVAALSEDPMIMLPNLRPESLQGDSVLVELFGSLGVQSRFTDGGLLLTAGDRSQPSKLWSYDFTLCPDLAQTLVVTLCFLGIPFRVTGTQTLRIKETDRVAALETEMGRLGYVLSAAEDGRWIAWEGTRRKPEPDPVIETYHDHRMAMAFAPAAIKHGPLAINDPVVVTKSYPGFWSDLEKAGFSVRS
jgi:3-phosphoshikimate 1-carboxyvinyltransferase